MQSRFALTSMHAKGLSSITQCYQPCSEGHSLVLACESSFLCHAELALLDWKRNKRNQCNYLKVLPAVI
ncbi:hypothetical protein L3X38_016557 [Prunus dulcis]|uniref:Uncharacterized protein n=1 Tax=Prunus dulcis TaxID=3755 RepID=A0AAD4W658_PRUDU|nr:hypothetical protein L3X38_016557 [Prunus dulcis]